MSSIWGTTITWLTDNGLTIGNAIILVTVVFAWLNLSKRFQGLFQTCSNVYSGTTTFLALVAAKLGLKPDFYELFSPSFPSVNVISNSPLGLSKRVIRVGKRLDAEKTAQDELPELLRRISKNPTNLEVQTVCMDYALTELLKKVDEDVRRKIHQEIYEDGGDAKNTMMVYGIIFRDAVLQEINSRRYRDNNEYLESA